MKYGMQSSAKDASHLSWFLYIYTTQVSMKAEVTWLRDTLRGDDVFELQVKLLKQVPEEYPYKDDE